MRIKTICVLGGTGFVGKHLIAALAEAQYQVRVLTRIREKHRELLVLPTVEVIDCSVHDEKALEKHFSGCQAVINLVGILNQSRRQSFRKVHVDLVNKVIQACRATGVMRLLHMSALHANGEKGPSEYLKTKGLGEKQVMAAQDDEFNVTVFRPSVIFGPDDSFFNRFYALLKMAPVMPLACAKAKFAPIYVGDVVKAYVTALHEPDCYGRAYDLCGPDVYTLRQVVDYILKVTGHRRLIVELGPALSKLQARALEWAPGKPFTTDNFLSLQVDSVCQGDFPDVFGFEPVAVDAVVPQYLGRLTSRLPYDQFRRRARR